MIDLSFIILEYQCLPESSHCLTSLREYSSDTSCEYIISSNSLYPEETRQRLIQESPDIQWIFNEKNGGYAYAMNRGIEAAKGEWIVLLNADTRLKSSMGFALKYFKEIPELGLLGPKIIDKRGDLQDCARSFMTPWLASQRIMARVFSGQRVLLEKGFDYEKAQPVNWVIGAFMMVKKSAIEKVGFLDERFFLYIEDMDWCRRFWESGFEVHYFPKLAVEYAGTRLSSSFLAEKSLPCRHSLIHLQSYFKYLWKYGCSHFRTGPIPK